MKTVFTNDMCAHVWAQLSQPHGCSNSMRFDGAVAYSYAQPVANLITPLGLQTVALFTSRKWSVTTARHVSLYQRAASQYTQFVVPDTFAGFDTRRVRDEAPNPELHVRNVAHLVDLYTKERNELMRVPGDSWRVRSDWDTSNPVEYPTRAHYSLAALSRDHQNYAAAFGLSYPALPWETDAATIIARRDRLQSSPEAQARKTKRERALAERAAVAEAQRLERLAECAKAVDEWRAGAPERLPYDAQEATDCSAMLRIKGDTVETSRGVTVPLEHARRAFAFYCSVLEEKCAPWYREQGKHATFTLGQFRLDSIDADGNVRAGCHLITRRELEAFGALLGVQS